MKHVFIFVLYTISFWNISFAQEIPAIYKKPIVFISVMNSKGEFQPSGTAFFIQIPDPKDSLFVFRYLVTAKHVLFNSSNKMITNQIEVRINTKQEYSRSTKLNLLQTGIFKNVYTHKDPSVDIVVIPLAPDAKIYDYECFPVEMLFGNKKEFMDSYVKEGTNIFYTGMFIPYQGYKKTSPIIRFGKVAMMPEEKIQWEDKENPAELFFVETTTFGGNSGSPVFSLKSNTNFNGSLTVGNAAPKLIGVIEGYYGEKLAVEIVNTSNKVPTYTSNVGITSVIPSYLVYEILYSGALISSRNTSQNR